MGRLEGRTAIVTGGGGPGIGSAICEAFAREGAAVVVADLDEGRARDTARRLTDAGGRALACAADVADAKDVERLAEAAARAFGPVGVLANNAGIVPGGRIEEITEEKWDRALGVHLKSAFLCARAVIPQMKAQKWGRIVSTASRAAYRASSGVSGLSDYAAAKAGLVGFSRALAIEVGAFGITANVVAPGLVSGSGMGPGAFLGDDEAAIEASRAEDQALPPRPVRPDEIAAAYLHLVGPWSDRISGMVLHVNGGSYFPV